MFGSGVGVLSPQYIACGATSLGSWLTVGDDRVEEECLGNEEAGALQVCRTLCSASLSPMPPMANRATVPLTQIPACWTYIPGPITQALA